MTHYVYKVQEPENELVLKEVQDEQGLLILSIDYLTDPPTEKHYRYSNQMVVEEKDLHDGVEIFRQTYEYDEKQRIIKQQQFINGELSEENRTEYRDNQVIQSTYQDNRLVAQRIETESDPDIRIIEFHQDGQLIQKNIERFDPVNMIYTTEIFDAKDALIITAVEKVDEEDRLLSWHEVSASGQLYKEQLFEFEGNNRTKATIKEFEHQTIEEIHEYEYNESGYQTLQLTKNKYGDKIAFYACVYDELNNLVGEKGIMGNKTQSFYNTYFGADIDFHFVHEYED